MFKDLMNFEKASFENIKCVVFRAELLKFI